MCKKEGYYVKFYGRFSLEFNIEKFAPPTIVCFSGELGYGFQEYLMFQNALQQGEANRGEYSRSTRIAGGGAE